MVLIVSSLTKSWYKINHKSLAHNILEMRKGLYLWATEKKVLLGTISDWNYSSRHQSFKKEFKNVNLWMDSKDFRRVRRKGMGKKHSMWSYKLNCTGRCYMFIQDGSTRIRSVIGGYSPKKYNGHFLEDKKEYLEDILDGSVVVADNHFQAGRNLFENITFLVNYPEKKMNVLMIRMMKKSH